VLDYTFGVKKDDRWNIENMVKWVKGCCEDMESKAGEQRLVMVAKHREKREKIEEMEGLD